MKKYCPFCDSELSETLWCEQCKRYAILYNTHGAAVRNSPADSETERKELYRRLTASLKNLYAAKSAVSASGSVSSAVPENSGKNPGKDTPKIILLSSMLLACFILCLVACAYLVLRRDTGSSGTALASRADAQSAYAAENTPESALEPAEPLFSETPVLSADEISDSGNTSQRPGEEASVPEGNFIPPEASQQPGEEASVPEETFIPPEASQQPGEAASPEADIADWRQLEQLDPLDLQIYGGTKYYYYAAEDIEALGLQCSYYHLEISYDDAADTVIDFFGEEASEEEPCDNTYFNSYVDSGYEYYTSFQQIISYDCGGLRCSLNYDTGSGIVHFVSFSGTHIEDYSELIQKISALASPEYDLSPEDLRESILSTGDVLLHLESSDMWHEEYVYQDSHISLAMTYSDGSYELQITSGKYADDTAMGTLSISRPK